MKLYSLSPDQLLMVDDLATGYQMAAKADVPVAFAAWSRQQSPSLLDAMGKLCDFTFHSTEDLYKFLFD